MDTRIAVITGAGSGIGRAVARTLIARGWHVAALGRRRDRLEETLDGAPGCLAIETDIAAPETVRAAFAQVAETYGRLDVLFNNAGMFGPAADVGAADWDEVAQTIDVNATGAFYCASAAFDLMRERGGRIINNGSISAQVPRPHSVAYAMSKHAVAGLTKASSSTAVRTGSPPRRSTSAMRPPRSSPPSGPARVPSSPTGPGTPSRASILRSPGG